MKVFKFGGASVKDAAGIKNVSNIIRRFQADKPYIVISALGKTTNALEAVLNAYFHRNADLREKLEKVKESHFQIINELFDSEHSIREEIHDTFAEIEWIIEEEPNDAYDYLYDQIVSIGEFLSSRIVAAYLNQVGIASTWLDVRDVILTDSTYREGNIQWAETEKRAQAVLPPLHAKGLVVTQGFVGITKENTTTTLGREGSDFTAAILAYCLNADSMTIWKDVPGVLTADPRLFENAVKLDHISYEEAIEMTYYGAQVIHPKTMRPLQNRNIPLYVKSFIDPDGLGTAVDGRPVLAPYPPVIVVKKGQALLQIASKDFYFINEEKLSDLFVLFTKYRLKINLMQNTAMKFLVCVDNHPERLQPLLAEMAAKYDTVCTEHLELVTVRHYDSATLEFLKYNRNVLLEERIPQTVQLVMG